MKIRFVYRFLPVLIVYNATIFNYVYKSFDGFSFGLFIFIKPKQRDKQLELALIEHELTHTKQTYRWLGINCILYRYSKRWRKKYEVEAHRQQLNYAPSEIEYLSINLSTKYDLDISVEEAKVLLLE